MNNASYRKFVSTIDPGATRNIQRLGNFFHVVEANEDFAIAWDNGPSTPFFAGLEYEAPDGKQFENVQITNTGTNPLTIECGIGSGGVRDGRLTVSAKLNVEDSADGSSFSDVVAAVEGSVVDLTGATFKGGSTQTFFTPGDNVNGAIMLFASVGSNDGGSNFAKLYSDELGDFAYLTKAAIALPKMILPAGCGLKSQTNGGSVNIAYRFL